MPLIDSGWSQNLGGSQRPKEAQVTAPGWVAVGHQDEGKLSWPHRLDALFFLSQNCGISFEGFLGKLDPVHLGMAGCRRALMPYHGKSSEGTVESHRRENL